MDTLSVVIYAVMIAVVLIEGRAMNAWSSCLPNTPERFVAKTKAKAWAYLLILASFVLYGMLYLLDYDTADRAFAWTMAIVSTLAAVLSLYKLSLDPGNDSFSNLFKKRQ